MCYRPQTVEEVWWKHHSTSLTPLVWSGGLHRKTTPAGFLCRGQALVGIHLLKKNIV